MECSGAEAAAACPPDLALSSTPCWPPSLFEWAGLGRSRTLLGWGRVGPPHVCLLGGGGRWTRTRGLGCHRGSLFYLGQEGGKGNVTHSAGCSQTCAGCFTRFCEMLPTTTARWICVNTTVLRGTRPRRKASRWPGLVFRSALFEVGVGR